MEKAKSTNAVKVPKKTSAEIIAELEKTGIDFSPIGLGPWSHSKLKVLKSCPLKFYLQYIIKQKPEVEADISVITETGKAAHRILEFVLGGKDITRAYSITREEFRKTLTDAEWEENIASVEFNISKFKEKIEGFEKQHGIKRILQELRIGCTKEWEPTGFFSDDVYFRGVIDLVIQLKNGDILILDHKYGTVSAMGLRNFQDQLNTYKILFHKGVEPIAGAQSGIHHIKEGEIVLDNYSDAAEIEESFIGRVEFSIQGAIDQVQELGFFKHIAGNGCKYCDYRTECKAGKLKEQEKATKKWFEIKKIT